MVDLASNVKTNPPIFVSPVSAGPVPIAATVSQAVAALTTIQQMQFPEDLPKYYMAMAAIDWDKRNNAGVIQNTDAQILLPLPDQLIDSQSVRWNQANLLAEMFDGGGKLLAGAAGMLAGRLGSSVNAISSAVSAIGGGTAAAGAIQLGSVYLRAFKGVSPNQFITILFESPEYKQHQFTWTLACNTPTEAEQIRKIIQYLNNNMAPAAGTSLGNAPGGFISGLYWDFPSVWLLSFKPNSDYIFKFKPAVLTNFVVDYAGGHAPSFHRADNRTNAGSGAPQNAPVSVILHAQFVEIEYWKKGDFITNMEIGGG